MPKFLVAIIAAAFSLVIGFACGALLTRPNSVFMEKIANENKMLQRKLEDANQRNMTLNNEIQTLRTKEQRLTSELLKALREKEEATKSIFE